jgi:hypothetical protein
MELLSEFIVPLILIGGAILQAWLGKKKAPPERPELEPEETFYPQEDTERDFRPMSNPRQDLDDLMEALGQKPSSDSYPENRIPIPPPVPAPPTLPIPPPLPPVIATYQPPLVIAPPPSPGPLVIQPSSQAASSYQIREEDQEKRFAHFSSFDVDEYIPPVKEPPIPRKSLPAPSLHSHSWRKRLQTQQDLRQALVLNEILQAPVSLR